MGLLLILAIYAYAIYVGIVFSFIVSQHFQPEKTNCLVKKIKQYTVGKWIFWFWTDGESK